MAFLTCEFQDLGGRTQVIRALSNTVRDGQLIRLGVGVYGRGQAESPGGPPCLAADFLTVARQALTKLGVAWEPGTWEYAYKAGHLPRAPEQPAVRVSKPLARNLSYRGQVLIIEHMPFSMRAS